MKTPETPLENLRGLLPKSPAEPTAPSSVEEEFVPRFLDLPPKRRTVGSKNLQLGALFLFLSVVLALAGNILTGPRIFLPLLASLAAFTLLWILAKLRVFQQRNGVFFAIGAVCLLGMIVGLLDLGYRSLEQWVKAASLAAAKSAPAPALSQPIPPADAAPAPPPTSESEAPLLSKELGINPPAPGSRLVKVLKDSRVTVGRKSYLLAAGELFAFEETKDGSAIFRANDLLLSLPMDAVEIIGAPSHDPSASLPVAENETPAQITQRAQAEAIRRYPELGVKDSPQNVIFVETYRELRNTGSELLKDPEWPLHIAESIARKEGWQSK